MVSNQPQEKDNFRSNLGYHQVKKFNSFSWLQQVLEQKKCWKLPELLVTGKKKFKYGNVSFIVKSMLITTGKET